MREKATKRNVPKNDLTGKRFSRLTVLEYDRAEPSGRGRYKHIWKCKCDCGNVFFASGRDIARGHAKSCGCMHIEQMEKYKTVNKKHGRITNKKGDRAYQAWLYIKARCFNPNNEHTYRFYGAKGITMWEPWTNDPEAFCQYVEKLENYDKPKMTIDRIDPHGNYEPGNIRWLSLADQQKNKTNNKYLEFQGKRNTITEWGKVTGIDRRTIQARLRLGWTIEDALTIEPKTGGHYKGQRRGVSLCRN